MEFDLALLEQDERELFALFLSVYGYGVSEHGIVLETIDTFDHSLRYELEGKRLRLYGNSLVHFGRAFHLFLQESWNPQKQEQIYFDDVGIVVDCSRNAVVKKEMMKELIRLCAASGINQLYLYMEDVYEIPEDPYFGAYRGRYTGSDLRELDLYGKRMGVELIPYIQTLAHLRTYFRWPHTKNLQDTEDILLVGCDETREFVRRMVVHASRPFSSNKIHVGMDEAAFLGLGQYLRDHGYQERYGIMRKHLDMVLEICAEEKLEVLMWGDMFFRLKSPTGDYYDLPEETEFDFVEELPPNVTLVYWDYYHHEKKEYDKNIRLHHKLTENLAFAGGGWTWNGISPNYRKAEKTLTEGLASCKEQNIKNVMCTFWLDNGAETPIRTAVYSILYFAQLCYQQEVKKEALDSWLRLLTGYGENAYQMLDAFDSPKGVLTDNKDADNPSKYLLYQDTLAGIFDGQIYGLGLDLYYKELEERMSTFLKENDGDGPMRKILQYYQVLAGVLARKATLGIEVKEAYHHGDREQLRRLIQRFDDCIDQVERLKDMREEIWFSECRPLGFEVLDIRLGGVRVRLESGKKRLEAYLSGKITEVEELDEPMVVYSRDTENADHRLCMCWSWQNIVSAGNIAGI